MNKQLALKTLFLVLVILSTTIVVGGPVVAGLANPKATSDELSIPEIMNRISPSVVLIDGECETGTGFLIDANGYVLTNNHIVKYEKEVGVFLTNREYVRGKICYRNEILDIAIIECPICGYPFISLSDHKEIRLGDDVVVIGYPRGPTLGYDPSIYKGIVSAFRNYDDVEYIQTDAPANPGSSGSPLINASGEIIGIVSFKMNGTEGINFALEINSITHIIDEAIQEIESNESLEIAIVQPTTTSANALKERTPGTPPPIQFHSDSLVYDGLCFVCHSLDSAVPFPGDHTGRDTDQCYECHTYSELG